MEKVDLGADRPRDEKEQGLPERILNFIPALQTVSTTIQTYLAVNRHSLSQLGFPYCVPGETEDMVVNVQFLYQQIVQRKLRGG